MSDSNIEFTSYTDRGLQTRFLRSSDGSINISEDEEPFIDFTAAGAGMGVTSVGLTGDGVVFNASVPGSPVTSSGSFAPTLHTQAAHKFLGGPMSGGAVAPTFRTLANADLPSTAVTPGSYTNADITINQQGVVTAASSGAPSSSPSAVLTNDNETGPFPSSVPILGSAGSYSIVLDPSRNATSTQEGNIAIGGYANATGTNCCIAIGASAGASANISVALGSNASAQARGATALGADSVATGIDSLAAIENSSATGDHSIALGYGSSTTHANNVAIGPNTQATGNNSAIALGNMAISSGNVTVAIGSSTYAVNDFDICLGSGASSTGATGGNNVCIGRGAVISGGNGNSVAIGESTAVSILDAVAIGTSAAASGYLSVAIGHVSNDDGIQQVFSIGSAGEQRDLLHVAHICSNTSTPTAVLDTGAGTGASYTYIGSDTAGVLNITTAGVPAGSNSIIATVTFKGPNPFVNGCAVILTPANVVTALLSGVTGIYASGGQTNWVLNAGSTGLTTGQTYSWNVVVLGY
jgi:trimeric autotransporter adhesin